MKKELFIAAMVIILFTIIYASVVWMKEYKKSTQLEQEMVTNRAFAKWCFEKYPANNVSEEIVNLRHCVVTNSHFSTDKNNAPLWADHAGMAQWLLDFANGTRADSPPMECAYRSYSLRGLYRSIGLQAKNLVVVQNNATYGDHVVVEVFNPETKTWQYEDPSYDAHFVLKENNRVLSASELLTIDSSQVAACDFKGRCGWGYKTVEGRNINAARNYWNVAYAKEDKLMKIAKNRFNEDEQRLINGKMQSYCQLRKKWCGNIEHLE